MHKLDTLWRFLNQHALIIAIVWLSLWFIIFFPTKFITIDEFHYIGNAYRLVEGSLRQVCDANYPGQFPNGEFCVSKYNIGTSVAFVPAAIWGESLAFIITFVMFGMSLLISKRILDLLGLERIYLLLIAWFPAFVYFSRTAFSEMFTQLAVVALLWAMLEFRRHRELKWLILAGVVTGLGVLTRYTAALPMVVIIATGIFWEFRHELAKTWKYIGAVTLGGLPFGIIFLLINNYLYGHPLRSGYSLSGEEVLSLTNLPVMLMSYLLVVNLIYPGMLFLPFLAKVKHLYWLILPVLATVFLYSLSPNSLFEGRVLDLILGIRFLIPVLPLAIVAYIGAIEFKSNQRWFRPLLITVIFVLAVGVLGINLVHQRFLVSTQVPWPSLSEYFSQNQ